MKETNKRTTLIATSFILKHSDSWHPFLHFLHHAIHIQHTQTITHHYSFQILSNICCQSSSPPSALHQPSLSPPFTSSSVQLSILKFHCVFSSSSNSHLDTNNAFINIDEAHLELFFMRLKLNASDIPHSSPSLTSITFDPMRMVGKYAGSWVQYLAFIFLFKEDSISVFRTSTKNLLA